MSQGQGTTAIFSALDSAKTHLYRFTAIMITGMEFFTYALFFITAVSMLMACLYYYNPKIENPGNNAITGMVLCVTLASQLLFGWVGDKLGRKKVYSIILITMVGCAVATGFSMRSASKTMIAWLCFFRFWLGFGIGSDYPLSAVIMSEYNNQNTQGEFIAAVFKMQGTRILVVGVSATAVSKAFWVAYFRSRTHHLRCPTCEPD